MIYQTLIESMDEIISATWDGVQFIEIYRGEYEMPIKAIDVWNYAENKPFVKPDAKALAEYVMGWMKDNEPTFVITTVTAQNIVQTILEPNAEGDLLEV